jgi:hypothetical protein
LRDVIEKYEPCRLKDRDNMLDFGNILQVRGAHARNCKRPNSLEADSPAAASVAQKISETRVDRVGRVRGTRQ